ncbi:NAD(P)-binding protein [Shewanella eurypsychrophilus]|uniref:NAD(P)-binding protein n=1 Tax=Shewanella eurypsychrophilus TaxID=2593656 RepID=A0ABX6V3K0_9GAMM|nr:MULTISPECIES: NAD(P)-binding protein [Shewanella]QFU21856.1 NAD(P)-binding protein [Shewanella sp. YLB-09]QPG57145.1 NAD(P)-binding protein [Shewanella eurypsychrophilus]
MEQLRPDFIYPPGSMLMHSPLVLNKADMYGFFMKGKQANLQKSIDTCLNQVAGSTMYFKVLSPYILTSFTRVEKAYSAYPEDRDKGWIQETDIITWIMVGRQNSADSDDISHVYFHPLYTFVNDSMALINGRELFGYPKNMCEYEMPQPGEPLTKLSLSAKSFKEFSPETELAMHPLLTVDCEAKEEDQLTTLEAITKTWQLFKDQTDFIPELDRLGEDQLFSLLFKPAIDQIFLKQLPDSAGQKAVYQAITASPATVKQVHSLSLLENDLIATVFDNASFPLKESLGVELGEQNVLLPYHVNFDFEVPQGEVLVDNSVLKKEKIAVLGGGVAAMTAAMCLTEQPGWQNKYEIDVYQLGWRIGGKGASGRNAEHGQRIEEHGLHIWFGFYQNAFSLMRKAYEELDRPEGAPLATFLDAFKPHSYIVLQEDVGGESDSWPIEFPLRDGIPGDSTEILTLWKVVKAAFSWIREWLKEMDDLLDETEKETAKPVHWFSEDWFERLKDRIEDSIEDSIEDTKENLASLGDSIECHLNQLVGRECDEHAHSPDEDDEGFIESAVDSFRARLEESFAEKLETNDELRRLYIASDLGLTILKGMFADGVFKHGFDVINDYDYREWLTKHGANQTFTVDSAPVRGFYDLVFAYEKGNFDKPNLEAGTIIRSMLRIALCYQGGVMWKMQAGMGDVVFTPYYEVLKRRGVNFHYFNQVDNLVCTNGSIEAIEITEQVKLKEGLESYNPLVDVKGLACWPSTPNYEQLDPQQAQLLKDNDINLEHFWSDWGAVYQTHFGEQLPKKQLVKGQDFDRVIFGLSIGSVPHVASEVIAQSEPLAKAVDKVKTVATQAYQLWLNEDLDGMGWQYTPESGEQPVLSGFTEPFDTWASMDQLLDKEDWQGLGPKNASYFCSALPVEHYPPRSDIEFPERKSQQAKEGAIGQLNNQIHKLWSHVGDEFPWQWLHAGDEVSEGAQGEARFDSQYWRANVDPSEQYVMSVKGSSKFRIDTDGTGIDNLYVTGDWINTGINASCVEAATMAGMHTSKAICGYPKVIKGEQDF